MAICGFAMYQDAKDRAAEFAKADAECKGGEFKTIAARDA